MPAPPEPQTGAIAGVVLAAGLSTRLGRPKQLLDIGGRPLVAHVAARCLASSLDRVIVVTGHHAKDVRAALAGLHVEIVINPDFSSGQATSLRAGVNAAGDADAIVVALADQPGISPVAIDRLVAARRVNRAPLGMTAYGDDRGHPVLFGRELFGELREIQGDQGGRDVLRRHKDDLVLVDGGSATVPVDIDTDEAYRQLLARGLD